jgi:hypothetical protein
MKKLFVLIVFMLAITSCAKERTLGEFSGSLYGDRSTRGDWVVLSESGGKIMDVWVLTNTIVTSVDNSDGWIFVDNEGNTVAIGEGAKIIRVKDDDTLSKYHEYHIEFETNY